MKRSAISRTATGRPSGHYVVVSTVGAERVRAFVPAPLPPKPTLVIDHALRDLFDRALLALGRLDSVTSLLPDPHLFLYMYVRKEAVLSSQIEGTQSSLSDLLLFELDEAPGAPLDDVVEVSNYVAALEHGIERLRSGFPLSNRLIRELHERLLARGRGASKQPGSFRRSQNWIGGTRPGNARFVPPPPALLAEAMGALERFMNDEPEGTERLVKAALVHAQFETIHPFLDGNGRVGRLLISLLLCADGALREPMLYLSLWFKAHRDEYYERLSRVRSDSDWIGWLAFFAEGVRETADGAVAAARSLAMMSQRDRATITGAGRRAGSALRVHDALQRRPVASIAALASESGLTLPTVTAALHTLTDLGIVREITGRRRSRLFSYVAYLDQLRAGTDPIERR
ncbi:MAG: Fic family protein [Thermoanaerobaculia bacterium]